ncbi:MAG: lamin tail domain-containing protein [bacterium]
MYGAPGTCAAVAGEAECTFDSLLMPCPEGQLCEGGACVAAAIPAPAAGEVIFTELMYDPHFDLLDASAEWLEITNVSAGPRRLDGCLLSDPGAQTPINPVVLPAGESLVFAVSLDPVLNGGLPGFQAMGFGLGNSGERLALTCAGVLIDEVTYDDVAPWPTGARAFTLSLDPAAYSAAANDQGPAWCLGRPVYYDDPDGPAGDNHGTPGALNPPCDVLADFGRLQFPLSIQGPPASEVMVYGRVFHPGLTDVSAATDASPLLRAQLGFGPDGAIPADDPGRFTWISASPNAGYNGINAGEPNNDEYVVAFRLPAAGGRYDYAWRFSADGGRTWRYADGQDAGSSDGYQLENAGDLLVEGDADPCAPNPCVAPPPGCVDADTVRVYQDPGRCAVVGGQAECTFDEVAMDCPAGDACVAGACVVAGPPLPAEGEVIFTEVMYDPHFDIADASGEWIEVRNIADGPRTLTGCLLGDAGATIALPELVVPAGGFALFANSADPALNGGLPAPAAVFRFALGNGGDPVRLLCNDVLIDTVTYDDGGDFPNAQARTISLDPGLEDAVLNDAGASWCLARRLLRRSRRTRGEQPRHAGRRQPALRRAGPVRPAAVPRRHPGRPGSGGHDLQPRLPGRHHRSDHPHGCVPLLRVQVGYGPDGTLPDAIAWTWFESFPNQGYDGALAGERDNDEYQTILRLPAPGTYDLAIRVSADGASRGPTPTARRPARRMATRSRTPAASSWAIRPPASPGRARSSSRKSCMIPRLYPTTWGSGSSSSTGRRATWT